MTGFPTLPPEHRRRSVLLGFVLLATFGLGLGYAYFLNCDSGCSAAVATPCSASAEAEMPEEAPCPYSAPAELAPSAQKTSPAVEPHHATGADDMPCSGSLSDWGALAPEPAEAAVKSADSAE